MYFWTVLQHADHQGDGEHGEQRGDEGDLGDERRIAAVLQTEDGAVGGYGHGDHHHVDVDNEVGEAHHTREEVDAQGQEDEPQGGSEVDGHVAHQRTQRQLRHAGAYDEQCCRHGDVAQHGERHADNAGDAVYLEGDDAHRQVGRQHGRRVEHLLLEMLPAHLTAPSDEQRADGEDGEGVDDVEHGGIEDGLVAEDGGDDGIAHEADVAVHQGEADGALVALPPRQVARQQEGYGGEQGVGDDADEQQRKDVLTVGQLTRHGRRQDECRTGDVDDQTRQLTVEVTTQKTKLSRHVANGYKAGKCYHYLKHQASASGSAALKFSRSSTWKALM